MTTAIEKPTASLAACVEIAERLTPELENSLRWLATFPGSGATLIIEGFVRDGELVLVADMPGGSGPHSWQDPTGRHEPAWKEGDSWRSTSTSDAHRSLLSFSVSLAPEGPESGEKGGASAPPRLSAANVRGS